MSRTALDYVKVCISWQIWFIDHGFHVVGEYPDVKSFTVIWKVLIEVLLTLLVV